MTTSPQLQNHQMLAWILDQASLSSPSRKDSGPLQRAMKSGRDRSLREVLQNLPVEHLEKIRNQVGVEGLAELLSISRESDPEFFSQALFRWAREQEGKNHLAVASLVLRHLSQDPAVNGKLRKKAKERAEVLLGSGSFGSRFEFHLDRFVDAVVDPATLSGMAVGNSSYAVARSFLLPRLLGSTSGLWTLIPGAARFAASCLALVPEVAAFWASSKGIREVLNPGSQAWDAKSNWQEIRSLGVTLGALKAAGFAFGRAGQWASQAATKAEASPLSRILAEKSLPLWHQGGMLAGIMLGHGAEIGLGWRKAQDFGSFLGDSLIFLTQFNVGGALSQKIFPKLYQFNAMLSARSAAQERASLEKIKAGKILKEMKNTLKGENIYLDGWSHVVEGITGSSSGLLKNSPKSLKDLMGIMNISNDGEDGKGRGGSSRPPGARISSRPPVQENLFQEQGEVILPERTGGEMDPFETIGEGRSFPAEMLLRIPSSTPVPILKNIGFGEGEAKELDPDKLERIRDGDFGFALGAALEKGIRKLLGPYPNLSMGGRIQDLDIETQNLVRHLDEWVGIAQYARRAGRKTFVESMEGVMGKGEGIHQYEILKEGLINLLGPHLGRGSLGPDQAIVSVGSGAMMGLLTLYRHRIMPGEYSWRTRLFAIARNPRVAQEINETGLYLEKLGPKKRVNFRHDPPIEAIPPTSDASKELSYSNPDVSQDEVLRSVQLQLLNVPSRALHQILHRRYIENLPSGTHLAEMIKGVIGPDRGEYQPAKGEQPSLFPYELIGQALKKYGREDVAVVTGFGFVPDIDLWYHRLVQLGFAGKESDRNFSSGADFVAKAFAGKRLNTPYVEASETHHQPSSEVGGAWKNVVSLKAGLEAIRYSEDHLDTDLTEKQLKEDLTTKIVDPLKDLLNQVLVHEKIKPNKAQFRFEVQEDINSCLKINLNSVLSLVREAVESEVPVYNIPELVEWLKTRVVKRRYEFAETRNPVMGIIVGLVELWNNRGANLEMREVIDKIDLTKEGVDSLGPLVLRNRYPGHHIELRALPEEIYQLHDLVNSSSPAVRPVRVGEYLREALTGMVPGIGEKDLRTALEGRSQRSVNILERELELYERRKKDARENFQDEEKQKAISRQQALFPHLLAALKEGDIRTVLDFPFNIPPYEKLVRIPISKGGTGTDLTYTFIRVDGQGIFDRLTQLGYYLRSFKPGEKLHIHVEATGLVGKENADKVWEIKNTAEKILGAFHGARPESEIKLWLNKSELDPDTSTREELQESQYYPALQPLVDRLNASRSDKVFSARDIRIARYAQSQLMEKFMTTQEGWPMLLGYQGGPFQEALHAALPRPEKQTMIKVYSEGRLTDVFTVYRGQGNEPMVLNHQLLNEFIENFPEDYGKLSAIEYFKGLPLEEFLQNLDRLAEIQKMDKLTFQIADLKSLPLEMALTGNVEKINPALLRIFLQMPSSARDDMIREINPFYEKSFEESRDELRVILSRYLKPFEENNREWIKGNPLYSLYKEFEKSGHHAFRRLIYRRPNSHSSNPPPKNDLSRQ